MYEMIFTQNFGCKHTLTYVCACHFVNVRSCMEAFGKILYASSTSLTGVFMCVLCLRVPRSVV